MFCLLGKSNFPFAFLLWWNWEFWNLHKSNLLWIIGPNFQTKNEDISQVDIAYPPLRLQPLFWMLYETFAWRSFSVRIGIANATSFYMITLQFRSLRIVILLVKLFWRKRKHTKDAQIRYIKGRTVNSVWRQEDINRDH